MDRWLGAQSRLRVRSSQFIVGPRWDALVGLSTLWFPLALWAVWALAEEFGREPREASVIAFTVLLNVPHFLMTASYTYLDPVERAHYRTRPIVYFVVPGLLLVVPWIYCATVGPLLFVTAWTLFGEHHVASQNLGFAALYRKRNGEGDIERRLDHLVFNSAWVTTVFAYGARPVEGIGLQFLARPAYSVPLESYGVILQALALFSITAFLLYLARQAQRAWLGLPVSLPKLLFMLTAWPSFIALPLFVHDAAILMVLRSGYHAVQYYALVRWVQQRRWRERDGGALRGGAMDWLMALNPFVYWAGHVVMALGIWFVSEVYSAWPGLGNDLSLRYLFFPGIALAHFFLDGMIWRLGSTHAKATLVPFLGPDRAGRDALA